MFGAPLIKRELIALLRTRRAFWLLLGVVAISSLMPLVEWPRSGNSLIDMARRSRELFAIFSATQLIVCLLCVPAFTAGAISGERERGTYDLLYTTLLSPFAIVAAKLIASIGYILLLLVAASPAVLVLSLFGGVTFETLTGVYVITFIAVVVTGITCLTASMRAPRTAQAAVRGLVSGAFWNIGLMMILILGSLLLTRIMAERFGSVPAGFEYIAATSPFMPLLSFSFGPPPGASLDTLFSGYLIYASLIGGAHLVYLLRRVRTPLLAVSPRGERLAAALTRSGRGGGTRGARRLSIACRWALSQRAIGLFRNPIFRKEIATEFFGSLWFRRLVFWVPLVILALVSMIENDPDDALAPIFFLALGLVVFLAPAAAAASLPREIEQGNIDLLRGTLIPMTSIANGKLVAGIFAWSGFVTGVLLLIFVRSLFVNGDVWTRSRTDPTIFVLWSHVAVTLILPITLVFCVAVSSLMGVLFRKTLSAMLASYAALAGLFVLLPIVLGLFFRVDFDDLPGDALATALNPFATYGVCVLDHGFSDDSVFTLALFVIIFGALGAGAWFATLQLCEVRCARDN